MFPVSLEYVLELIPLNVLCTRRFMDAHAGECTVRVTGGLRREAAVGREREEWEGKTEEVQGAPRCTRCGQHPQK